MTARSFKSSVSFMYILPGAALLYYLSRVNYLLFHGLTEIFDVIIAGGIAMIAWNSRHLVRRHFLFFIGLGYPFISLLGILHTFSFKGLSVFPAEYGANLPAQLWIATRSLECFTFLIAPHFLSKRLKPEFVLAGYTLVTGLILATIFVWPIFPDCYVEGTGLTTFKKVSEYLISSAWIAVFFILLVHRAKFDPQILNQLFLVVGCNVAAELVFTHYTDIYGFMNFSGHLLRLTAIIFLYRAIIEKSLNDPYRSLFLEVFQSEQYFRSMYETAPLAFVIWDENCQVTHWNKRAEKMFGWTETEVRGRNFFEFLLPEDDRPVVSDVVADLRRGTLNNRSVNSNLTKSGETIICEWNNSILRGKDGKFSGVISLGLDITEQKNAENMIQNQAEKIKHFAYSVAHDLKSPSVTLSGLADHFQRKYSEILDERGQMFCNQIKQVSNSITDLVQNINTYMVSKELPLHVKKVDLKVLVRLLREEFSSRVAERELDWVEPEKLPRIRADQVALQRILRNFIDNALKYGGDTLSQIEIGYLETETHHKLFVWDDGKGLSPEVEDKIFETFHRDKTAIGTSGAGLGLAITHELAQKLGGDVWTEKPTYSGAIFFVSVSKNL